MFISFEGTDGAGKSTQIAKLKTYLEHKGFQVLCTREPGGTPCGEALRGIALSQDYPDMSAETELLIMMAARVQHLHEVIEPALHEGKVVISDRFSDATVAYQGYGADLDLTLISSVMDLFDVNRYLTKTFFLDMDVKKAFARRGISQDRFEDKGLAFLEKVRSGYLAIEKMCPRRVSRVNADQSEEQVFEEIRSKVDVVLRENF